MKTRILFKSLVAILVCGAVSCQKKSDDPTPEIPRQLYIAAGLCYAGGGFTAPNIASVGKTLTRLNMNSHNYEMIHDYADLSSENANTYAAGFYDNGDGHLMIAVENATSGRRIDKIVKAFNGTKTVHYTNTGVLATALKGISKAADGGFLVGRTTIIERIDPSPVRKTTTASAAWGQAFGAGSNCASNNTAITQIVAMPAFPGTSFGKYIYTHQTTGQQDVGIIGQNGYIANGDCLANQAGNSALTNGATAIASYTNHLATTAAPTSMVFIPNSSGGGGKLLVSYSGYSATGNGTSGQNLFSALVLYTITEDATTASITDGTVIYNDHQYFFGVTAMAYDAVTKHLYVATSNSLAAAPTGYNIEKFAVDLDAKTALRVTNSNGSSFQSSNSYTNCITDMKVSD